MHVGNVVIRRLDGAIRIIDWELSPAPLLPFNAARTLKIRKQGAREHASFGRYDSNPMIGDRGTQCDSLFQNCHCNFPYEFLLPADLTGGAYRNNYHCNLIG